MLAPARYARATPKLRVIRARLLTREAFKDLALSPTLEDAMAVLRDTPYQALTSASAPSAIQALALKVYYDRARSILRVLPGEARPVVEAFLREEEARDVLAIMRSVAEGGELPLLPTGDIEGTLPWRLRRDPESLISQQRLLEALERTWMKPYARAAQRLAGEMRSTAPITWVSLAATVLEYQRALQGYSRMTRLDLEAILCPYLQYKVLESLVNAKSLGIPARALDRILGEMNCCYMAWPPLRAAYEREPGPAELVVSTREVFGLLRLDTRKSLPEMMGEARREALRLSAEEALAAYAGYPFTPVLAAAAMMLSKVEMLNVVAVLTGIRARLKPDEISEMLVVY